MKFYQLRLFFFVFPPKKKCNKKCWNVNLYRFWIRTFPKYLFLEVHIGAHVNISFNSLFFFLLLQTTFSKSSWLKSIHSWTGKNIRDERKEILSSWIAIICHWTLSVSFTYHQWSLLQSISTRWGETLQLFPVDNIE